MMNEKKNILFFVRFIVCLFCSIGIFGSLRGADEDVVSSSIPDAPPIPYLPGSSSVSRIPLAPPVGNVPAAPEVPTIPGAPSVPVAPVVPSTPKVLQVPGGSRGDLLAEIQEGKGVRAKEEKAELPLLDEQALAALTAEQKKQSDKLLIDTLARLSRTCIKPEAGKPYPVTLDNYKKSVKKTCTDLLKNEFFFKRAELRQIRDEGFDLFLQENQFNDLDYLNSSFDTIVAAGVDLFLQAFFNKNVIDEQAIRYLVAVFAGLHRNPTNERKTDANKYISNDQVLQAITTAGTIAQLVDLLLMMCINKEFLHYKRPTADAAPHLLDSWLDDSDSKMKQKVGLGAVGAAFEEPVVRLLSNLEPLMRKGVKSKELAGRLSATMQKQLLYVDVMEQDDRVAILSKLSSLIDQYQKMFTPGKTVQGATPGEVVTDINTLLHWETITTFSALEAALRKMAKTAGDKTGSVEKLAQLIKSNPENKDEIIRQYDLLFKANKNKLTDLYDTHAKEIAVLRALRAARERSRKIGAQAEGQKEAELKGIQKGKKVVSSESLRLQSYQGAQLYKELQKIYGTSFPDEVRQRFTALFRRSEDVYKLFDTLIKNSMGSLAGLGFSKEDFVKMVEPYGLLLMMIEEFNITKNYKKLLNGLVALNTGAKKADEESFDDVINNKEYIHDITTYALYKNRLKEVVAALERSDLVGVRNGIETIVKQAGIGVESTEDFRNLMAELKESLVSVFYTRVVNRIRALSDGSVTKQEDAFEFPAPTNAGWQQRKRDSYLVMAIARSGMYKPLLQLLANKSVTEIDMQELDAVLAELISSPSLKEIVKKTLHDRWSATSKPDNYQKLLDRESTSIVEYLQRYLNDQRDQLRALQQVVGNKEK